MRDAITGRFVKGHSGNPSGTIAGTPKVKQALMRLLNLSVSSRFVPRTRGEKVAFELYNLATKSKDDRAKLLAIREVFDRLYGRPPQEIAINEAQLNSDIEQELARLGLLTSNPVIELPKTPAGYLAEPQAAESAAPLAESHDEVHRPVLVMGGV